MPCLTKSETNGIRQVVSTVYRVVYRDIENKCNWAAHIAVMGGRQGAVVRIWPTVNRTW
jgi:hypothetical protein